jgi:hypothetical protein
MSLNFHLVCCVVDYVLMTERHFRAASTLCSEAAVNFDCNSDSGQDIMSTGTGLAATGHAS